jgi:hypothetical protein
MEAGTALAIVSLSVQVLTGAMNYYKYWKDCEQDLRDLQTALERLVTILCHLESTLQKPCLDPIMASMIASACKGLGQGVNEMKILLETVQQHGESSNLIERVKRAGRRACYPFRASTISRFMEIVEDMTDHLGLGLQVLSL